MRKTLFNPYKHKRKWERGLKKASVFVFSKDNALNHKDFAWKQSKRNPLWRENEKKQWQDKLKITTLIITSLATFGIILYHPFFYISNLEISGLQRIPHQELHDTIFATIKYNRWLFFPGKNYFIVNLDEIRDIIKEKYPIENIKVTKTFPEKIEIILEEKISTIIYDDGKNYSYVGADGSIVEILRRVGDDEWQQLNPIITTTSTTSTDKEGDEEKENLNDSPKIHKPDIKILINDFGDYPIVYDKTDKNYQAGDPVLSPKSVSGIIDWFNLINKKSDIPFNYLILENEIGDGVIKTKEGWEIMINVDNHVQEQFYELAHLLKEKIDRQTVNYINLRYLGKVYWQ